MKVFIERTTKAPRNRIEIDWAAEGQEWRECLRSVKSVAGARFQKEAKNWTAPLDLETCRQLRNLFGKALVIGPDLHSWAVEAKRQEDTLGSLAHADDATLSVLPAALPKLAGAVHPYQRAGIKFVAEGNGVLVADQPGLGKTLEVLGGIVESGRAIGASLIVAPLTSLDAVWEQEFIKWEIPGKVFVPLGSKANRQKVLAAFEKYDGDKWLVVNPAMIQWRKDATNTGPHTIKAKEKDRFNACRCDASRAAHWHYVDAFDTFSRTTFDNIVIDECHKGAVRNPKTITAQALYALRLSEGGKKVAISGTPMTKRAADLWGILHWLEPHTFSSAWTFYARWFEIHDNGFGKTVGKLRSEVRDEFFRSLTPYMLRRTKAEVLTQLPPKRFVDVWCHMDKEQEKQYRSMEKEGAVKVGDTDVMSTSILAEFTRLKQFAIALNATDGKGTLVPTATSCKLDALMELLEERSIFDGTVEADQAEKVVIFSQFEQVVSLVVSALRERGVAVERITGKENKSGQRKAIQDAFQADGGPQVLVMTTTAGGVAITLDRADTVVFMDELWSPGDMEQAEDRVHRASRVHNVTIYNLRTANTIDQYIMETVDAKEDQFNFILDVRRQIMQASGVEA